ncbi:MAG: hypothetical protein ACLRIL_05375 [Fusicatenibacter saccharivorans]
MDLTDIIYSNDYINILIQNYVAQSERYQMLFPESSALLTLNPQYSVLFLERSLLPENLFGAVPFTGLPKLFTPLSTLSLEVSGIVQTQNLYGGGYTGKNVIFGFLDTGIDYRHPAFLHANGQSRILAVWDQTDRTGTPPAQFPYGSLYTKSDLDAALRKQAIHSFCRSGHRSRRARHVCRRRGRRYSGCLRRISRRRTGGRFCRC